MAVPPPPPLLTYEQALEKWLSNPAADRGPVDAIAICRERPSLIWPDGGDEVFSIMDTASGRLLGEDELPGTEAASLTWDVLRPKVDADSTPTKKIGSGSA